MTNVTSYATPAVGAITVAATVPDEDLLHVVADVQADPVEAQKRIDRWLRGQVPHVFDHEWAHILQVVAYPLLFVRAARAAGQVSSWARTLAEAPTGTPLPVRMAPDQVTSLSELVETLPLRLYVEHDGIRIEPMHSMRPRRGVIREIDLVEEDATIFQYRIEVSSRGSGHGYRRWLAERPRYSALFSFVSTFATDDQALALIPILVRLALRTLRPVEALAAMLTDVVRDGADMFIPDMPDADGDAWAEEFFLGRLRERVPAVADTSALIYGLSFEDEQGYIEPSDLAAIVDQTPHLPLSALARWSREDGMLIDDVLRSPWHYVDRDGRRDARLGRYGAPLSQYVLTGTPSGRRAVLLQPSDAMRRTPARTDAPPGSSADRLADIAHEMWRLTSVVNVALGKREPMEQCPHECCRVHASGLCRGWTPIPDDPADCNFPVMLKVATGKDVSLDGSHLADAT